MTYPNAYAGVKRILSARILYLIAAILLIGGAVFFMVSNKMITSEGVNTAVLDELMNDPSKAVEVVGPASIPVLLGLALFVVAFIMELVGLGKAGKDEGAFRTGLWVAIIGLVAFIVLGVVNRTENTILTAVSNIVAQLIGIIVAFCIVKGIMNLAVKLNKADMLPTGKVINVFLAIWLIVAIITIVLPLVVPGEQMEQIAQYISLVGDLAGIIAFFMILAYLGRAKKMLAEN